MTVQCALGRPLPARFGLETLRRRAFPAGTTGSAAPAPRKSLNKPQKNLAARPPSPKLTQDEHDAKPFPLKRGASTSQCLSVERPG